MKSATERVWNRTIWSSWPLAGLLACSVAGDDPAELELEDDEPAASLEGMEALVADDGPVAQVPGFDLDVAADGDDVVITHAAQPGAAEYQLWQSSEPYFEPGDASSTLLGTSAGLVHTVADGATVTEATYWRVVAVAGGGAQASTTVGAWVQTLVPGYTLMGFPLLDTGLGDAESLHAAVPELTEIWRYRPEAGGFDIWYGTGEANLSWEAGEAVPVQSGAAGPIVLRQFGLVPVAADLATTLAPGLSVVTMPLMTEPTTASELSELLAGITQLASWNEDSQSFEYFNPPSLGVDFALEPGQGVWIWTTEQQPWPHIVTCGDGVAEGDEQCDDGNLVGYDGCEPTCERTIAEITASTGVTCIRTIHGDVKCWGYGPITGNQTLSNVGDDETPASVGFASLGAPAIDISTADAVTCAVLETGSIRCFGSSAYGTLGLGFNTTVGDNEPPSAFAPINFGNLGGATFLNVSVSAGRSACGVLSDGNVRCWGDAQGLGWNRGTLIAGAIGDNESPSVLAPVPVGLPATEVFSTFYGHLVRTATGSFRAWGPGDPQFARGAATYQAIAVQPGNPSPADVGDLPFDGIEMTNVDFSFSTGAACSVQSNGALYCWGSGTYGALGQMLGGIGGVGGPTITAAGPVNVGGEVTTVECMSNSVCAALANGQTRCWGYNGQGQLGRGHTANVGYTEPPVVGEATALGEPVVAFSDAVQGSHFCALLESGALKCWGANGHGQLGYGHTNTIGDQPGEMGAALPAVQVF